MYTARLLQHSGLAHGQRRGVSQCRAGALAHRPGSIRGGLTNRLGSMGRPRVTGLLLLLWLVLLVSIGFGVRLLLLVSAGLGCYSVAEQGTAAGVVP
jgi:hypothetical protein